MRKATAAAVLAIAASAGAVERVPEGPGLAARYRGDVGLERDRAVMLVEHFEDNIPSVKKRWTNVKDPKGKVLSLSRDVPPGSVGRHSLQMTHTRGENTGGHLWRLFKDGVDEMYARFYVKFDTEHDYVHHFVKIGAWRDSPRWPQGEAGHRHDGAKSFQTGIEPYGSWGRLPPVGKWFMYTYWCDMKSFDGGKSYYGNGFSPGRDVIAPRGEWICVEFMVRANSSPGKSDGAQGFWIDGKLAGFWGPGTARGRWRGDSFRPGGGELFPGFRWRTDMRLKINTFWLLYYMTDGALKQNKQKNPRAQNRVWFDHVVVARKYIGPMVTGRRSSRKQAAPRPSAEPKDAEGPTCLAAR